MKNAWLLLGMAIGSGAMAADPGTMQPGRWNYTVKLEMPGMPFAMPPQSFQHCLTQADVDSGKQYQDRQNQECQARDLKQSPGKASFTLVCKDGTTGTAEYSFTPTSMTGKTVMNRQGQAMAMNMSAQRSGDCK